MEPQKAVAAHEQGWRQTSGRQISVNQLDFIPECKEYIGLGSLGANCNFHEVAPVRKLGMWQQGPIEEPLVQVLSAEIKGQAKDESGHWF